MKKILLSLLAGAMTLSFIACSEESDPAQPVSIPDFMQKTATVTGYIRMNENLVAATPRWSAPKASDFKMVVTVPYSDLIQDDQTGRVWSTTDVTYHTSGKFEAVVPVGFAGSEVSLSLSDFPGTQRNYDAVAEKDVDFSVIWQWGDPKKVKVLTAGELKYLNDTPVTLDAKIIQISGDQIQ